MKNWGFKLWETLSMIADVILYMLLVIIIFSVLLFVPFAGVIWLIKVLFAIF